MPAGLAIPIISAAMQAVPLIGGLFGGGAQRRAARRINPVNATYEESPYTKSLYGAGANLYKGRMAGATAAQQNIAQNAANTNASVARNAGDASTALAMAAGIQGQADAAYGNLALTEAQDKINRFGVYSDVTQQMTNERDKVFQDKLRKYYDDLNYKRALEGASMQNTQNAFNKIGELGQAGMALWQGGAFGGNNTGSGGSTFTPRYAPTTFQQASIPQIQTQTPAQTFNNIPSSPYIRRY